MDIDAIRAIAQCKESEWAVTRWADMDKSDRGSHNRVVRPNNQSSGGGAQWLRPESVTVLDDGDRIVTLIQRVDGSRLKVIAGKAGPGRVSAVEMIEVVEWGDEDIVKGYLAEEQGKGKVEVDGEVEVEALTA